MCNADAMFVAQSALRFVQHESAHPNAARLLNETLALNRATEFDAATAARGWVWKMIIIFFYFANRN